MTPQKRISIRGAIAGLLAGLVGLGVGHLVAGITSPLGSPAVAVGELSIDLTPAPVKNFAISTFGSHDKLVLVSGIVVVLAVLAAIFGVLAVRRLWYGLAGLGVFAVVGMIAAATRPTATAGYVLPSLVGGAVAAGALVLLIRAAGQIVPAQTGRAAAGRPKPGPAKPGRAKTDDGVQVSRRLTASVRVVERPRRQFLTLSATAAGTAAVAGLGGRLLVERANVTSAEQSMHLPRPVKRAVLPAGVDLRVPGLSPFVTPNSAFYRVDTAIVLPQIPPANWRLRIHGMVSRELTLTFDQLLRRPLIEDYITLCCVSNPVAGPYIGNARWLGASLGALLRDAGIRAGADQLYCTSFDGFTSGTPVQTAMDGRDAMLAIAMNGKPLPVEHGFPVRTVVPGLYGYVSACKWITDIEVTTYANNAAYWAQRGWTQQAPIKTESRIDVPSGQGPVTKGATVIAGVAWAQHKGIDAVEARVDNGPWRQATLAAVPGIDTWRQWKLPWDAAPGTHRIEARATDATGYTQTPLIEPPEPNGASGYPMVSVTVTG